MQKAILIQLALGLLVGGSLGAVMGYFGKCTTGACPLTANPWRGAFIGALIGGMFAFSAGSSRPVPQAGQEHASLLIGSTEDFEREVLNADKPVLVDFYADWCGPCRQLAPTIEQLVAQYEGRAVVSKVNIDRHSELAGRYGIQSIPTILFFKDGQEVGRLVGVHSESAYASVLDELAG